MFYNDFSMDDWGKINSTFTPQLEYKYLPKEPTYKGAGKSSGGSLNILKDSQYRLNNSFEIIFKNQLSIFNKNKETYKPDNLQYNNNSYFGYIINEAAFSYTPKKIDTLTFVAGKKVFEFSTSQFTSPGNPSMAGLNLVSPFNQQEGILQKYIK